LFGPNKVGEGQKSGFGVLPQKVSREGGPEKKKGLWAEVDVDLREMADLPVDSMGEGGKLCPTA